MREFTPCTSLNRVVIHSRHHQRLIFVGQVAGRTVMTLEGLNIGGNGLHSAQQTMVDADASQCGFCTPGFVMALSALAQTSTVADNTEIHNALAGNLCRCTGYKSIVPYVHACGEPPLMLAISVWLAVRDAVASLADYALMPRLGTPATPERILFAVDNIRDRSEARS